MQFYLISDIRLNNNQRGFVKQLILPAVLLFGVGSDCLALNQKDSVVIVTGAAAAVGLWSWWGHVSNKNAIKRADFLWQECHDFIDKHDRHLGDDLQKNLYLLESNPIFKRQHDIASVYKSLSSKMDWFWNRSHCMKLAYENSKILKKSLDAYLGVFNTVKQQLAVQSVAALWQKFSRYDLAYDPSCDIIKSTTFQELSEHQLLLESAAINNLYGELYNASPYCYEFAEAHKKIVAMKKAHDRWLSICAQIRRYDSIIEKYQDFMSHIYQPRNKQDVVTDARRNSFGEYPLLNFAKNINADIEQLSMMTLRFSYVRLQNGGIITFGNALTVVVKHLMMVASIVTSSSFYQDELYCYQENLRLQEEQRRLAQEQRRLNQNINEISNEIERLKLENLRLAQELKNKQKS